MKKIFLLIASGAVAASAIAQTKSLNSLVYTAKDKQSMHYVNQKFNYTPTKHASGAANKTTVGGSRWYDYIPFVTSAVGTPQQSVIPIWSNNKIMQNFTSGLDTINYLSVSQYINPVGYTAPNGNKIGFHGWADNSIFPNETMNVTNGNAYVVDSISIGGAYVKNPNRPTNIVDTLLITVSPAAGQYTIQKATNAWVSKYITTTPNETALRANAVLNVDSVNKTAFTDVAATPAKTWKVELKDADRQEPDAQGNINLKDWKFAVPGGGLNIGANGGFAVTVTFISGDTYPASQDTFTEYHHFMPVSTFVGANQDMRYFYYDLNDRNMSSLMFAGDSSQYVPSVIIEGINTNAFRYEYHQISARVTCATCPTTSVNDVTKNINSVTVYPNPVSTEARIRYSLKNETEANLTITNTVGQVVKAKNLGKISVGETTVDMSDLSNGVYFYTLTADGQSQTGRMLVNH